MSKKVDIGPRPSLKSTVASSDDWVKNPEKGKSMKRLTVDIPEDMHRQIKADCAWRGVKITDVIREMLAERYSGTQEK